MDDIERESLKKKEMAKLNKLFKDISPNKKKLVDRLIQNAAHMAVTLAELQELIDQDGPIIFGKNGNGFDIAQEHPASKTYNTLIQRYSSVIKQLTDMLPDAKAETVNKAGEALAAFVAKGKPGL